MAAGVRDLAASKTSKKYHIKLADWLFVDPTFSKKYSTYLPLKKTFLNSRLVDIMSPTCFKLVVILLDHAHIVRASCYDLDANMLPSCREPVENVLLRLVEYQVLTEPPLLINKLINELSNRSENNFSDQEKFIQKPIEKTLLQNPKEKKIKNWFEKFVVEEMGSLDTGLIILSPKVEKCFGGEPGFREWISGLTSAKKFKEISAEEQLRYFKKSLTDEMKLRGVL